MAMFVWQKALQLPSATKNSVRFLHDKPPENPFAESAFDTDLYHSLQEPYQSFECLPKGIHLSQASDVDASGLVRMTVSFMLDHLRCHNVKPHVVFGPESKEGVWASGERKHFDFTSGRDGEEYFESDWIYHVELPNLKAGGQPYWYRVEVFEVTTEQQQRYRKLRKSPVVAYSPTCSFFTPPMPGNPTTLALVGDLGSSTDATLTMSSMMKATNPTLSDYPVSLIMILGDIAYANAKMHRWTHWFELMEPLFRSTPVEVAAGNHEIECDNRTWEIFVPYENYFRNANQIGAAKMKPIPEDYLAEELEYNCWRQSEFLGSYDYGNSFYAFRHGLVQMIVLNSYTESGVESAQYKWLAKFLESVDRSVTPWLVVTFHCPFYSTFDNHQDEMQAVFMRESMEPLFIKHQVNLVVSGHDHAYMRSHPMAYGKKDKSGRAPIYLIVGAGGANEEHGEFLHKWPERWVAKRDGYEYGYANFHAANATHAHLTWVRDGTTKKGVRDHVWLINKYSPGCSDNFEGP
jgi:hypothetical protein